MKRYSAKTVEEAVLKDAGLWSVNNLHRLRSAVRRYIDHLG